MLTWLRMGHEALHTSCVLGLVAVVLASDLVPSSCLNEVFSCASGCRSSLSVGVTILKKEYLLSSEVKWTRIKRTLNTVFTSSF